MAKQSYQPYSQYALDALILMGQLIREARMAESMTAADLAVRAGVSRGLIHRIERGDPGCSIGTVFEVAAICGMSLFGQDQRLLASHLSRQQEKMALLPKAVRVGKRLLKDDF